MATRQLILCSPLCFLLNKYGKVQLNLLKTAVSEFYSVDSIVEAKCQLLDDAESATLSFKLPHIPRRRECQYRVTKEIDDICNIIQLLDENGALDNLPRYVCDHPDNMPSLRLFEGDMVLLLSRIERMDARLNELGTVLEAIISKCTKETGVLSTPVIRTVVHASCQTGQELLQSKVRIMTSRNFADPRSTSSSQVIQRRQPEIVSAGASSWATRTDTTSSTPMEIPLLGGRFAPLMSTDDEACLSSDGFQVVQNRRSARRNKRALDSPKENNEKPVENKRQPGKEKARVFGKASSQYISAATKLYKKAIFCVDNVNISCSQVDLEAHVENMDVHVISCNPVASRRRRNESPSKAASRHAFRLCIDADDKDKLLNADNWPDSVTISDW